jgi:hypothetical protein
MTADLVRVDTYRIPRLFADADLCAFPFHMLCRASVGRLVEFRGCFDGLAAHVGGTV